MNPVLQCACFSSVPISISAAADRPPLRLTSSDTAFEQLKNLLLAQRRRGKGGKLAVLSNLDIFVLGALAKLFATSLSYPLVLLKSRLVRVDLALTPSVQIVADLISALQQSASHAYPSLSAALVHIIRTEGPAGLYRGISTKLLQSVLTASFLFLGQAKVVEIVKKVSTGRPLAPLACVCTD